MSKPLNFSAVFRFSIYGIEPAAAAARFGSHLHHVLEDAAERDAVLTNLSFCRMSSPAGWTASFSIRKSFATSAWADTPTEAVLGALWIADAHAGWIDANPQRSQHASRDPRLLIPAKPAGKLPNGKQMSAEQQALFDELFAE